MDLFPWGCSVIKDIFLINYAALVVYLSEKNNIIRRCQNNKINE